MSATHLPSPTVYLPPLADSLPSGRLHPVAADALRMAAGVVLVGVLAQVSIPLPGTPVPLTGQTPGVLLCGMLLGSRRGLLSLATYLALGAAGVPLFAGAGAGIASLVGPTAGYLWAFAPAAWLVGRLAERGWDRRAGASAMAMGLGSLLILLVGSLWLSVFTGGWVNGLQKGLMPFLPIETLKIALLFGLLPAIRRRLPTGR
ncbi:MAG: biotin transporter BioY [Capsulimonadales bacterium]|nr:biotin transporter BioY [Capsulimonadales bacterium]